MALVRRVTSPSDRSSRLVLHQRRAMPGRVAQVHDERVNIVAKAPPAEV